MQITNYPNIDEKVIYEKLENGLEVYLIPKKDYSETCAVFTTRFGGLNTGYEIEYNNSIRDVEWEIFDLLQDKIGYVVEETEFLVDLLSGDKLHEESKKFPYLMK